MFIDINQILEISGNLRKFLKFMGTFHNLYPTDQSFRLDEMKVEFSVGTLTFPLMTSMAVTGASLTVLPRRQLLSVG